MVYKCFDKKSLGSGVATLANKSAANNEIKQNLQLAKELHKPVIRNVKKRTVYSGFKDKIWGADFADMQYWANIIKESIIYCVQFVCLVNMHGLFL